MFDGLTIADFIDAGVSGVVVLAIMTGWLLPRWTYSEIKRERDEWRALAMRAIGTGEVAVNALETIKEKAAES